MRRVIVTGAAGFIGSRLVGQLREHGYSVLEVDGPTASGAGGTLYADLARPGVLDAHLDQSTTVYHLAAQASVPGSIEDPLRDFRNNVLALVHVLESVRSAGCRMVFASSAAVFDPETPLPWAETGRQLPTSPYGAAKISGEAYCRAYHRSFGVDVKIVRFFNVYGEGMRRFAVHDFVRKIEASPEGIEILGDGEQVRDYLYVGDAVRALELVATRGRPGEDYNVGSGEPMTSLELARAVGRVMGRPNLRILPSGRSFPGDVTAWYSDPSKIRALGFAPEVPLDEGLRRTVAWLRERPGEPERFSSLVRS